MYVGEVISGAALHGTVKQERGGKGGTAIFMGTIQMSAPITLYQSIFKKKN
jgi:hypothetical protein